MKLMKRIILAVLIGLTMQLSAQNRKSELNLSRFNNSEFTMIFDAYIYGQPNRNFRILDILPGSHSMQVFKVEKYRDYSGVWKEKFEIIFSAMVDIPENANITALIDERNQYVVVSSFALFEDHHRGQERHDRDHDDVPAPPPCMSEDQFHDLKHSMSTKPFDDTKLAVAKQAIEANGVSTHQVKELMDMFSFDDNKLELAKHAYRYVVDKNNYYLVNDAFTFSSHIEELNEYIKKQK